VEEAGLLDAVFDAVTEEDLELALETFVDDAVEEVLNSTNLQPSVPGVVCEVISDIVRSDSEVDMDMVGDDVVNGSTAAVYPYLPPDGLISYDTQVR